jgi:hypothetical protein
MRLLPASVMVVVAILCGAAGLARAQTTTVYMRGETDKRGPLLLGVRVAPAIDVRNTGNQFAVGLGVGLAVTRDRNAYVLFQPQAQFGDGLSIISLPVAFQYDIRLYSRYRGALYFYPRAGLGYSVIVGSRVVDDNGFRTVVDGANHYGVAIPEVGLKYVLDGRYNFNFEPFSLPIYFRANEVALQYRLLFGFGVNI